MDTSRIVLSIVTAVGFLAMSVAALLRGRRHPTTQPFAQLTAALGAYKLFEPVSDFSGDPSWDLLEDVAATLAAPPALAVFAAYIGMSRRLRWAHRGGLVYFGLVAGLHGLQPWLPPVLALDKAEWATAMLGGLVPPFLGLFVLGVQHWKLSAPQTRTQTQLLAATLLLGIGGVCTDLLSMIGYPVPRLSDFGLVLSVFPLGWVAFRSDLIHQSKGALAIALAVAGVASGVAQVSAYALAGTRLGLFALGSAASTLLIIASVRPLLTGHGEAKLRSRYLTTMGRLSDQMAHDLRNPLSAILGSVQVLQEELRRTSASPTALRYLGLIEAQARRMNRAVEDYKRMGRVEPRFRCIRVESLVRECLNSFRVVADERAQVHLHISEPLPQVRADPELLQAALDNLLRNALESFEAGGGNIWVSLSVRRNWVHAQLRLEVRDDGPGMDPSVAERAFDEVFTTKASGSGLGLSYVARVAEVHEGRTFLDSRPGRGTRVGLELPVPTSPDEAG